MRTNIIIRLATVVVVALALFLLPQLWGWSGLPTVVIAAVVILMFFLVRWHARHTGYRCPECNHTFMVSPITDFLSPHLGGVKMLRCPQCGHSPWCQEIDRDDVSDPAPSSPPPSFESSHGGTSLQIQIAIVLIIYCGLWTYTLYAWSSPTIGISYWTALKIPLVTIILPVLHVTFCLFAFRHGYRSRIYFFVSLFIIVFLLLAVWMQREILTGQS